jgi:carboxylesterase type B
MVVRASQFDICGIWLKLNFFLALLLMWLQIAPDPKPAAPVDLSAPPLATTDCGTVHGTLEGGLPVFRSIPYAHAERWGHPRATTSWSGTLDATAYRPQCIEILAVAYTRLQMPPIASEDCLTLTVWGANTSVTSEPLPVMVFFHGGMLTIEDAKRNFTLLQHTGVVVVDVAYRLNVFGYLSTRELAATDSRGTSGNYGLLDQLESLRWVQRNVASFGGDPGRVTAFGWSAGGSSIYAMLACPAARGLFHRAMVLSGSPNKTAAMAVAHAQHASIVTALGCGGDVLSRFDATLGQQASAEVVACMRSRSVSELMAALPMGSAYGPNTRTTPSWEEKNIWNVPTHSDGLRPPTFLGVDGLCPAKPLMEALHEPTIDVPLIIHTMAHEQGRRPSNHFNASRMSAPEFVAQLGRYFDQLFGEGFGAELATHYEAEIAENPQKAWNAIAADIGVNCGNLEVAAAAASGLGERVYSVFNRMESPFGYHTSKGHLRWAYHGFALDLATDNEGAMGKRVRGWWHEFASTGAVAEWRVADGGDGNGIVTNVVTNDTVHSETAFKADLCALWREHGAGPDFWWGD